MVAMSALHSLTAELHTGFLTLAMIGIAVTFLCQLVIRFGRGGMFSRWSTRLRGYTEAAGIMGAFFGVFALLLSAYTGINSRSSFDALYSDPITANKILLTIVVTAIWSMVVIIRLRVGKRLWTSGGFALFYTATAAVGFAITALIGSMGAHLTQGESTIDPLLNSVGIDYIKFFLMDANLAMIISIISLAVIVICIFLSARMRLLTVRIAKKDAKWTLPRIEEPKR
ncbi:MAG TPA: hypothetical protein VGK23_08280 [Methanomassiliicoccales archaeon]